MTRLGLTTVVWFASVMSAQAQATTPGQAPGRAATAAAASSHATLQLRLQVDPAFGERLRNELRAAIGAELNPTWIDAPAPGISVLVIERTSDGRVALTLRQSLEPITRTLPWNADEQAVARDVALMASNLVQNQTSDLLTDAPAASHEAAPVADGETSAYDSSTSTALASPSARAQAGQDAQLERTERAALLAPHLAARAKRYDPGKGWAGVLAVLGLAGLITFSVADDDNGSTGFRVAGLVGAGLWTAGGSAGPVRTSESLCTARAGFASKACRWVNSQSCSRGSARDWASSGPVGVRVR